MRVCICVGVGGVCQFIVLCVFLIAWFLTPPGVYVRAVRDFEKMLAYWFERNKVPLLVDEHQTPEAMLEGLIDELQTLSLRYASDIGYKVYTEYKPRPATKRTQGGGTRPKTALEGLSSTDDSASEGEAVPEPESCDAQPGSRAAMYEELVGPRFKQHPLDGPTQRFLKQHVQEFIRDRLNPTRKVKDALAWWAANEQRWPMVAAVARHSLCVPAAAACSERAFSRSGHLVRARRSCLGDEKIEQLSHLSNNLDIE